MSNFPASISFLEGLGAASVSDLDIIGRWERSDSSKSLSVSIGIKENGETFCFDISKFAMGLHGMVAGTSGSGKTELLKTLLLSMAVHFSPDDVNFYFIQYMDDDTHYIEHLPHFAGNTSGAARSYHDRYSVLRSLKSLSGEVNRRLRIFAGVKDLPVQNMETYQKYRKAHPELNLEPLPHLIVVLQDYSEFMSQCPDAFGDIEFIMRIHSAGIHMILVMHSPQGLLMSRHEVYLNFRICMRTDSESDSKGILGVEDASRLSHPGEAYIRGRSYNGDLVHMQTFYADSPYRPAPSIPATTSLLDRLRSFFGWEKHTNSSTALNPESEQPESSVIVQEIIKTAQEHHFTHARHICPDPLPQVIALDELIAGREAYDRISKTWSKKNSGLAVTVGLVDDPEGQTQYPLVLDFMKDGHQILYGAPSTGKTTFLQTAILSAALSYTPEQVKFLLFDYGSFALKMFGGLPHCIIAADQTDEAELKKAGEFLKHELTERSKLFSTEGVTTISAYREASGCSIPAIIVAVDNIDLLNNANSWLMDIFTQTAITGTSLGIYLMITASCTSGGFMFRLSSYIKSKHTLQMIDKGDYRCLVGAELRMRPENYKGRGLTQGGLEYQTALCIDDTSEADRNKKLKVLCEEMSSAWTEKLALLTVEELHLNKDSVRIGLNTWTREPVMFSYSNMNGCIIAGDKGSGKSTILAKIAQAASKAPYTRVYVYEDKPFIEKLCPDAVIMHTPEEADNVLDKFFEEFLQRSYSPEDRIIFCIDDFMKFYLDITQESADILEAIARGGKDRCVYIYVTCTNIELIKFSAAKVQTFTELIKNGNAIITGGRLNDYDVLRELHQSDDMTFAEHQGAVIHNNTVTPVMFHAS